MKTGILKLSLAALGCLLALAAQHASANTVYSLGVGNTSLSPTYPAPYGSVTVSLTDSTHATVTFTGGSGGGFTYLFGGAQAIDVNVNGTFSVGSIAGMTSPTVTSGNVSSFGSFNVTIDNFDGFSDAHTPMSFILTDTGGTWADSAHVLSANSSGYIVAAHIFVMDANGGNPATGFAANGSTPSVPDGGSTVALLGLAMLGLGSVRSAFKK